MALNLNTIADKFAAILGTKKIPIKMSELEADVNNVIEKGQWAIRTLKRQSPKGFIIPDEFTDWEWRILYLEYSYNSFVARSGINKFYYYSPSYERNRNEDFVFTKTDNLITTGGGNTDNRINTLQVLFTTGGGY